MSSSKEFLQDIKDYFVYNKRERNQTIILLVSIFLVIVGIVITNLCFHRTPLDLSEFDSKTNEFIASHRDTLHLKLKSNREGQPVIANQSKDTVQFGQKQFPASAYSAKANTPSISIK